MDDVQELQLNIRAEGTPVPLSFPKDTTSTDQPAPSKVKHWQWWLAVAFNTFFVVAGNSVGTLLGRFYYDQGGNSKWMATLVGTCGSPLLLLPLLLCPSPSGTAASPPTARPPIAKIALIYISLGLLISIDNLMYSYALFYLPVSTFSLVCATQLAFNAVFSYFINSQKFTALVLNSVVLLTLSASLLGASPDDSKDSNVSKQNYTLGILLTIGASAGFSLILSLMQLAFEKVSKKENVSIVLELQMYTGIVASFAACIGLFGSGQWRGLNEEMDGFRKGRLAYVMTLVWIAVSWQVYSVGAVGLIFMVSSLFSNVISTLALPVVPIFAVIFFGDRMDGVKVMAIFIALWGFLSYIYQQYLDDCRAKKDTATENK